MIVNELYELKFDTQSMLDAKKQKTKEELHKELEIQNNNGENNLDQSSVIVNEEEQENKKKGEIKPKVPIKEYDYLLSMKIKKFEKLKKEVEEEKIPTFSSINTSSSNSCKKLKPKTKLKSKKNRKI